MKSSGGLGFRLGVALLTLIGVVWSFGSAGMAVWLMDYVFYESLETSRPNTLFSTFLLASFLVLTRWAFKVFSIVVRRLDRPRQ